MRNSLARGPDMRFGLKSCAVPGMMELLSLTGRTKSRPCPHMPVHVVSATPRPAQGRLAAERVIALPASGQTRWPRRRLGFDRREVVLVANHVPWRDPAITGSAHLLEIDSKRILLDCGLFDSDRIDPNSPNRQFPFDPRMLDAVIVSHAHNDHIGRLPCLIRAGYTGPIYTTPATGDIANVMLRDSARIQREEVRNAHLKYPHIEAPEPLFDLADVEWMVERLQRVPYSQPMEVVPGVSLTYFDAGHILGSAIVQLDYRENGRPRRFVFTGDLGRRNTHLLPDPTPIQNIDILVSESTYGNRELDPYDRLIKQLHAIVARATRLQSKIVIPAFSLGRTQRMVYCLQELFAVHKVRPIPIYVDSPLATRLTEIHRDHPDAYTPQARGLMDKDPALFRLEVRRVLRDLGRLAAAQPLERADGDHRLGGHVRGRPHPPPPAARRLRPRQRDRDRQLPGRGDPGPPDLRGGRAGPDLRPMVRPECRGLRARRLLGPRRPQRPGAGGTSRPAATSSKPSSCTASPSRWRPWPPSSSRS